LVLTLLTLLLARQRSIDTWTYLIGGWAVIQATLPFNLGSVVQASLGSVVFAGAYNRLGGAFITLVILAMTSRTGSNGDTWLSVWLGVVLALAFLIKVTAFQVCAAVCVTHVMLCNVSSNRWWWGRPVGLALVLLVAVLWPTGMLGPYIAALRTLSDVRMDLWRERLGVTELMLSNHGLELLVLAIVAVLGALRGRAWPRRCQGMLFWYAITCILILLYTLSNFGDNGLFPALAAVHALVCDPKLESSESSGESPYWQDTLKALSKGFLVLGALIYSGMCVLWCWAFVQHAQVARLIHFPVQSEALAGYHLIESSAWASRPPVHVPGVTVDDRSPGTYAAYVQGLDEGLKFLADHLKDKSHSVYALDFPSYAFALLGGYRIPSRTYPWILYGHELSMRVHPNKEQLLSDVDVLMVSKCSLSLGNRENIFHIYEKYILLDWHVIGQLKCWDVFVRN
jgi:hypothetical protein